MNEVIAARAPGFRPKVAVLEAVAPVTMAPSWQAWEPLLTGHGYRFALFDGRTLLLTRTAAPFRSLNAPEVTTSSPPFSPDNTEI